MVTAGEVSSKEPERVQLLALEDSVRNWPWHRADCYQRFCQKKPATFLGTIH